LKNKGVSKTDVRVGFRDSPGKEICRPLSAITACTFRTRNANANVRTLRATCLLATAPKGVQATQHPSDMVM
jgi:hypothetical protein